MTPDRRILAKFGGSSLADAAQFQKVKAIVAADPARRFVVVSAPGKRNKRDEKITDLLYLCHRLQREGSDFSAPFDKIRQRYLDIERTLGLGTHIAAELDVVQQALTRGASVEYIASRGEYLCALLMADYLGRPFVDASRVIRFCDGRYSDLMTMELRDVVRGMERAVIPGFYGATENGSIVTFSRGGSDITGSVMARAAEVDLYENWTDVDGFLMADPRIVDNPPPMPYVTYCELRELSYMGASVLHEESIFPVRQARIPIHVKNTNAPDAPGTLIIPDSRLLDIPRRGTLTGIAGRRGFTAVTLTRDNLHAQQGFVYRLLGILDRYHVSVESMPSGIDSVTAVMDDRALCGVMDDIYHDIRTELAPDSMQVQSCLALISIVGKGMQRTSGAAATVFAALRDAGVSVRVIDQGALEMSIIIGVEQRDFELAIRAVYGAFMEHSGGHSPH